MSEDNRSLPQGAGATTGSTGTGTTTANTGGTSSPNTGTTATTTGSSTSSGSVSPPAGYGDNRAAGSVTFAADRYQGEESSSSRALIVSERQSTGPSAAAVVGAAVAGALVGAAVPFMLAGRSSSSSRGSSRNEESVEESVVINRPSRDVYDFWRNFENLPQFMDNIESVRSLGSDGRRSHWVIKAPAGTSVEFDSFVTEDVPGKVIAWRSEEDASVPNRGHVEFRESSSGSTVVRVSLSYQPPAGTAGKLVAKLLGREPSVQARQDLQNLKTLLENRG